MDKTTGICSVRTVPAHGTNELTGSNSPLAWLQPLCYGKHEVPGAAPYCNPDCQQKICMYQYQLNVQLNVHFIQMHI